MSDCQNTKKVICEIQENGWIRGVDGMIIGRLCDDARQYSQVVSFSDVEESKYAEYMKEVTDTLRKDKEYYYSWQANIAVCMQDVLIGVDNVHELSNIGAKNFLNLLIR